MRSEDLPLVTPSNFRKFKPVWLKTAEGRARFRRVAALRAEWNALDVLDLEDVRGYEKLWSVLRKAFLPELLLHEYACRCAEWALSFVDSPDPRSVEAIRVKRRWMCGEVTDLELGFARVVAWEVVSEMAARSAELSVAWSASRYAVDSALGAAAWAVEEAAERHSGLSLAGDLEREAAREHEVAMLRALIDEWEEQA